MSKTMAELQRKAEQQGWRILRSSKHWKWLSPDGRSIVVTGCTASDHRADLNNLARLRRAGYRD